MRAIARRTAAQTNVCSGIVAEALSASGRSINLRRAAIQFLLFRYTSAAPNRPITRQSDFNILVMEVDHTCPVVRAQELGLLAGSPVTTAWCLSSWREVITTLEPVVATDRRLLVWEAGPLSIHYAPWDWVNTEAKVMLVGITPGAFQATEALREAQACLRAGRPAEETLRRADATGSFAGPMRSNLVTMLDGIGLAEALGVDSSARLFDTHHHRAALCSAIDYPVFVNGQNYGGASPPLARDPVPRSLVRASLGARIAMTPNALVIPLGRAAQDAVTLLAAEDLVSPAQCLTGFPPRQGPMDTGRGNTPPTERR
jgi:hypothetical protein